MIDDKFLKSVIEPSVSSTVDDQDATLDADEQRTEARKREWHKFQIAMIRKLPYAVTVFGIIFFVALFFVILPFSEMELGAESLPEWLRNYSQAFIAALGSFGVTVLAVIVSELLK